MAVSAETDGCRVLVAASGHPAIQKDVTQELSTSVSNIPANATNSLQLISRRSSSGSRHGLDHHARLLHCNSEVSKEVLLPHSVQESRFSWVRTSFFEGVFAILILINSVVVVVETDHRHRNDGIGWVISDTIWTVIFLVEVVLRMLALKHLWPRSPWNIFDLLLVLVSITDAWLMPLIKSQFDLRALSVFRIARLFRMLRILRLLRLLRHFQKLVLLVQALWGAFRALIWFMILVAAVLYVFALVLTRLSSLDPYLRDNGLVQLWFGSMLRSLFTLFQLMTLEGWPDIARETLNEIPWLTTFYVCFIILTNITLLNIVAGVLTENVLSTARKEAARQLERKEKVLQAEREWVGEELASLDQNGDGMLDLHELQAAEASPQQAPHLAKFLQLASLKTQEAEDLFRLVDYDDAGVVSYKVFVEAATAGAWPDKVQALPAPEEGHLAARLTARPRDLALAEGVSKRCGACWGYAQQTAVTEADAQMLLRSGGGVLRSAGVGGRSQPEQPLRRESDGAYGGAWPHPRGPLRPLGVRGHRRAAPRLLRAAAGHGVQAPRPPGARRVRGTCRLLTPCTCTSECLAEAGPAV
eukprot:CAMPEP_0171161728 /NCGR_PEP_ID=MMETSP0790-20130122/4219_1 /TAXON_ID=2925 /ORGANISM="Alexandrium catenella, Strain OF101" /LENGTH=585 /DNA_ID=CAMNT_0011626295 /DNA_START=103 /DNA_END=1859 /DNA_ORIENTATION=-